MSCQLSIGFTEEVSKGEIQRMREEEAKSVCRIALEVGGYSIFSIESFEAVSDALVVMCDVPTI